MKKLLSIFLLLVLVFSLAACGAAPEENVEADPESELNTEEHPYRVCHICSQLGDNSFTDSCHNGLVEAANEFGFELVTNQVGEDGIINAVREAGQQGYDLVAAPAGSDLRAMLDKESMDYPDTIFCAINGQISDFPNQIPVFPKEYEGSYLAGIIAGYTTENGKFAVTGGQSNDPMVKLMDTYEAMAIQVATDRGIEGAEATRAFIDSWTDVSATKDLVSSMIDNGADSVFCYSNEGTSGAIQAAEEKGVTFVGFSADKNGESDCVVGSVSMNWAAVYPTIVENILSGNWTGKTDIGVKEGVFEVIPTDQMSEECVAAVDEAIEAINNGEIDFEQYFEAAE